MKLILYDESNLILFLNNLQIPDLDLENRDELEEYFRSLFLKLHNQYKIDISGYYVIDIYADSHYGLIIEMQREELDYYVYDDYQVDMRICIHSIPILFELDEYIFLNHEDFDMIWYHNKWFAYPKKKLNEIEIGKLLEYATLYYEEDTDQIIHNGIHL